MKLELIVTLLGWSLAGRKGIFVSSSTSSSSFSRILQEDTTTSNPIFGTRNGYDQGGTEPMCWKTTWQTGNTSIVVAQNNSNLIERSNQEMFALSKQSELLPECYSDTKLTVLSYSMDASEKPQLFLGQPYTIQMELQMDFANIPIDLRNVTVTNTTTNVTTSTPFPDIREVYFRLHLCNAIREGFCNPIRDTRAADASLTREQADQPLAGNHANASLPFPENADKWVYNPNVTLNGLTLDDDDDDEDSSYYYGRWCKWKLRRQNETTMYRTLIPVTIEFPLPPDSDVYTGARPFFFVGQAVVPLGLDTQGEQVRLDIAQTVPSKVVYVSPPPEIATVGTTTKITLAVIIGLTGSFALGCFLAILVYREHAIVRLAQGPFLAVMAAACCIQIVFSFSHLPVSDVFCRLRGPFVELPMALVGAVLVGRVWRIYGTLSTVHKVGRAGNKNNDQTTKKPFLDTYCVGCLDTLARIPFFLVSCCGSKNGNKTNNSGRRSIRSAVTAKETWCLIGMLIVPQVVLQVYAATMDDHAQLVTEMNEMGNVGRVVCSSVDDWVALMGTGISCLLYVLAVVMAWLSRDLPFAFNEKDQIFHAATICAIITAMSIAVAKVMDDPSTSPSAVVLLQSIVSIGIALTVLVILVWPKIHRAWNGQPVVMSHVLGSSFSQSSETNTTNTSCTPNHHHHHSPTKPLSFSLDATTNDEEHNVIMDPTTTSWNEHEALPSHIESQILDLQIAFRGVTDKCGNGCTLTKSEWQGLHERIQQLNSDLHRVHVE